jgi:hypothetical protein
MKACEFATCWGGWVDWNGWIVIDYVAEMGVKFGFYEKNRFLAQKNTKILRNLRKKS